MCLVCGGGVGRACIDRLNHELRFDHQISKSERLSDLVDTRVASTTDDESKVEGSFEEALSTRSC